MNNDCMKHGAFGWFELMTTDVEAAKAYYKGLFGWEYETVPVTGSEYTMIKVDGDAVAGIMEMPEECKGMPPSWDIYITVEDVDKVVKTVLDSGGSILKPAFDIPEVGRFSVMKISELPVPENQ